MKFTDGAWKVREGVSISSPAQVYDTTVESDSFTVFAPYQRIYHRGQTLQGPLFTIRFSSPMPDVIRVQITHYAGEARKRPSFSIASSDDTSVKIEDTDDFIGLTSGSLSVKVSKQKWFVGFYDGDELITSSELKGMGYVQTADGSTYMKEQLSLGVGECVYGLGERFTPFVKNGQSVEIWNCDGGTMSEQAYKNVPFYLTNKGYGVFVNHPGLVSFEIATERVQKAQFSVAGESLDYFVINGPSIKQVLEKYTALTGRPALPPPWSFGLWLSTSFTTNYDEATVCGFVDGMAEREIPLHVFHFDCFWMKDYHWCNFQWDERVFPNPAAMLARLKEKGLRVCVWINPYIAQRSKLFDEGMENGYLLKKPNGDVWQWDLWQPGMAIVDFTNPAACEWYASKLRQLLDMGVDCLKTDFGERIPTAVVWHDGSDPERMHNYYSYLYNKVVFSVLEEKFGKGNAVVFARSATAGSQQFPVHWGGDCWATYESMAESLRGGLSLCLSGFAFWSHDIGGFEDTATPDIYKRWIAFGLLSSHSRLHGSSSYRVPWMFDEESVDVLRYFVNLKCSLMPYIFGLACEARSTGIPVMRPMVMEFMDDPTCDYIDRQYMLGDSLLVAPVFHPDGSVTYYLPEGTWTHFMTGEKVEGGRWITERHGYMSLPLMVRPGSIVAVGSDDTRPDYDYADGVTLHVFEPQAGETASTTVYSPTGEPELDVTVQLNDNELLINAQGKGKPWIILLREIYEVESTAGAAASLEENGVRITPDDYRNCTARVVLKQEGRCIGDD